MVFGTVLGTKVQKGHKGAFFPGECHYTEKVSLHSLLSVIKQKKRSNVGIRILLS